MNNQVKGNKSRGHIKQKIRTAPSRTVQYGTVQYRIYGQRYKLTTNTQTEEKLTTNKRQRKQRPILGKNQNGPVMRRYNTVKYRAKN